MWNNFFVVIILSIVTGEASRMHVISSLLSWQRMELINLCQCWMYCYRYIHDSKHVFIKAAILPRRSFRLRNSIMQAFFRCPVTWQSAITLLWHTNSNAASRFVPEFWRRKRVLSTCYLPYVYSYVRLYRVSLIIIPSKNHTTIFRIKND